MKDNLQKIINVYNNTNVAPNTDFFTNVISMLSRTKQNKNQLYTCNMASSDTYGGILDTLVIKVYTDVCNTRVYLTSYITVDNNNKLSVSTVYSEKYMYFCINMNDYKDILNSSDLQRDTIIGVLSKNSDLLTHALTEMLKQLKNINVIDIKDQTEDIL